VGVVSGESRESGAAAGRKPAELLSALGVSLGDEILERALTHRSYAYENGGLPTNERLEFLGDSVLGLIVTGTLFRGYPNLPEGQLAKLRAAVVNMTALADVARGLNLGAYVRLGRGEEGTGGRDKPSILADTLEAVIGAVYIDCGLDPASDLVHRLFDPVIERSARLGAGLDWKTSLQELTAAELLGVPEYQVEESGPDHQKSFRAVVKVGGQVLGTGEGRSKKAAEQQAAEAAWIEISSRNADQNAKDAQEAQGAQGSQGLHGAHRAQGVHGTQGTHGAQGEAGRAGARALQEP
jgi:ribonuclease III